MRFSDQARLRRLAQAQALQQPPKQIGSHGEGLAHLGSALFGALTERDITGEVRAEEKRQADKLAAALRGELPAAAPHAAEQPGWLARHASALFGGGENGGEMPATQNPMPVAQGIPPVAPQGAPGIPMPPQAPGAPGAAPAQPGGLTRERLLAMALDPDLAPHVPTLAALLPPTARERGPMAVSPGSTVIDPETGRVIYTAPRVPTGGGGGSGTGATVGNLHGVTEWGRDAEGKWVKLGTDRQGRPVVIRPPEGVTFEPPTRSVDLGTGTQPVGPGAQPVGPAIPRDTVAREGQEAMGKTIGERAAAAPAAISNADRSLRMLDELVGHPALSGTTGTLSWTGIIPGTPMADFSARVKEIEGGAFLEAFNSLRGGGQITQIEGDKATAAIARMRTSVSPADFRRAMADLKQIVETGRQRALADAERGQRLLQGSSVQPPAAAPAAPATAPRLRYNPATDQIE